MIRTLMTLVALAVTATAALPASAYTPNPGTKRGIIIVGGNVNRVALNPQPLPPQTQKFGIYNKYNGVLLNPQPLPPRYRAQYGR